MSKNDLYFSLIKLGTISLTNDSSSILGTTIIIFSFTLVKATYNNLIFSEISSCLIYLFNNVFIIVSLYESSTYGKTKPYLLS